jgi:hypothetical protein
VAWVISPTATSIKKDDLTSIEKLPVGTYFKVKLSEGEPPPPSDGATPAPELRPDAVGTEAGM